MKVILSLLVRDEADIIDANLRYHLERGVDFVIATDNGSEDGTLGILEEHEREGHLHLIREPSQTYEQGKWVTRMARLAATQFDADWVLHADADEFLVPEGGSLKDPLGEVPEQYGALTVPRFNFVPRPDNDGSFTDRMTVRAVRSTNTAGRLLHPKVAHRASAEARIGHGCHQIVGGELRPLGGWYPIEALHFPLRSYAQWEGKIRQGTQAKRSGNLKRWQAKLADDADGGTKVTSLVHGHRLYEQGRLADEYARLVHSDADVEAGLRDGRLAIDTRLQEALGSSRRKPQAVGQRAAGGERDHLRRNGADLAAAPHTADPRAARESALVRTVAAHEQHAHELTSELRKRLRNELTERRKLERKLNKATRRLARATGRLDAIDASPWWRLGRLLRSPLRAVAALGRQRVR